METLTKENFWDEMEQKYPKAMAHFKEWIDKYKQDNHWHMLFNYTVGANELASGVVSPKADIAKERAPKYHELPIAMQFGIFIEYVNGWNNNITPSKLAITLQEEEFVPGIRAWINAALFFQENNWKHGYEYNR